MPLVPAKTISTIAVCDRSSSSVIKGQSTGPDYSAPADTLCYGAAYQRLGNGNMRVKVQPINILGRAQNTKERKLGEVHVGDLKVVEKRIDAFGRALTVAQVVDPIQNVEVPILQLFDADLLWISANQMRMRGFEICNNTQFAQSWDIEVLAVAANAKG